MNLKLLSSLPIFVFAVACGGAKSELEASQRTPAAVAQVRATPSDNGNMTVSVEVEHLAPPSKVHKDASTYVVWARPRDGDAKPQNLGALTVDDDRKGKLEGVTALKNFDVIVTPESSAQVTSPTHEPVLTGQVQK